ncbi:hypothetical protein RclHR1_14290001 [Rhizophagus clarus]|uniref:Uncharacterized protein n=1 Tax=Rhizophagus clarus TaxID=94130 RepID=A0A2Z6QSS4_9GLOM|nr:hypothetical protein RclHR1_14290001 [Rhizophagus clarus]
MFQNFHVEAVLNVFEGLEFHGTSKIAVFQMLSEWNMGLRRFAASRCFLNVITRNPEGLRLFGRIIDRISKLPNTPGLNLQISVSKHNFKGSRFATLQSPHGYNFKDPQFSDRLLDGISKV